MNQFAWLAVVFGVFVALRIMATIAYARMCKTQKQKLENYRAAIEYLGQHYQSNVIVNQDLNSATGIVPGGVSFGMGLPEMSSPARKFRRVKK